MKNTLSYLLFFFITGILFAQTDGISYQAVIIGPDKQELPGVDAEGNIFPDAAIAVRFTILDETNNVEYQEVQTTNTDAFGRINLLIGSVNPDEFMKISWDGSNKDLKVEIDFSGAGSNFLDMSREQLTFVPYAYHRNITAAGTLKVDDATELNSELLVKGPTQLESVLAVAGNTDLNSDLLVLGATSLNDSLNLNKGKAANLSGNLTVLGTSDLKGDTKLERIDVAGTSMLNGQVIIDVTMDNKDKGDEYRNYPLLVQGSEQGIAIKVNGQKTVSNNYITFWDQQGTDIERGSMWGRIEGITLDELENDASYQRDLRLKRFDIAAETINVTLSALEITQGIIDVVASSSSSTACVGAGACITAPIPAFIISAGTNLVMKIFNGGETVIKLGIAVKNKNIFLEEAEKNIGVSYQSGAGDYAEWIPKENPTEVFSAGELVGIKNGRVTKNTWGVEKIMVVSTRPIVLGNMPQPMKEHEYVKIAFMGQVPVYVLGKIEPGDYILPNILGSEFARAVHPDNMNTRDYKKVAGVAWNVIKEITDGLNIVNVAVGINANDMSEQISKQEEELKAMKEVFIQLKSKVTKSNTILASLVPGYEEAIGAMGNTSVSTIVTTKTEQVEKSENKNIVHPQEDEIIYFEVSREQIETSIELARQQYQQLVSDQYLTSKLLIGKNEIAPDDLKSSELTAIRNPTLWEKMDTDPEYKEENIRFIQANLKKAYHTHKKYASKFTNLKVME